MNSTSGRNITAIVIALALVFSFIATGFSQSYGTTIETEELNTEPPVNTAESLIETHNAIVASIDSTSDVPEEFNVRWTQPGTVEGNSGVSLFVVDCLPGEYPGNEQVMLAEGVEIVQQYVIGSGADYLSVLFLVANFGDEDQVVKLGTTCIDEEGGESGDNDVDEGDDITRVTNNVLINNIVNNIVKNINKNITIINNSTNNTIITPPPTGNTTDPGTGGGGNITELAVPIEEGRVEQQEETPANASTTSGFQAPPEVVEEEGEETPAVTQPSEEETETPPTEGEETPAAPPTEEEETTEGESPPSPITTEEEPSTSTDPDGSEESEGVDG